MTQVTYLQNPTGETVVKVGDEVEDANVRFFVGAINDSHNLCSIDKTKPWTVKTTTDPMRKCMEQGNYAVNAALLRVVPDNASLTADRDHWKEACQDLDEKRKWTDPDRPLTKDPWGMAARVFGIVMNMLATLGFFSTLIALGYFLEIWK